MNLLKKFQLKKQHRMFSFFVNKIDRNESILVNLGVVKDARVGHIQYMVEHHSVIQRYLLAVDLRLTTDMIQVEAEI